MKTNIRTVFNSFLIISLFLTACRDEESEFIVPSAEQAIESNSVVANLLQNTSMNDGSVDNIIDSASCFNIELPITVTVNGQEIMVNSALDFQVIENIVDQFEDDDDSLNIEYPINIVFADFREVTINSLAELEDFADECGEDNQEDDDIECIDIVYPISASLFNLSNELINTVSISNDRDLYHFIEDLSENIIVNMEFPITVLLSDSTQLEVFNLIDLEDIIEDAKDDCDEDDDNDFDDDDCNNCTNDQLSDVLLQCPGWNVEKLERNDEDLEELYLGYSFGFMSNGVLTVVNGNDSIAGEWSSSGEGNNIRLSINVPGLGDFNENWVVHEIEQEADEDKVDLRIEDDRLRFRSQCGD